MEAEEQPKLSYSAEARTPLRLREALRRVSPSVHGLYRRRIPRRRFKCAWHRHGHRVHLPSTLGPPAHGVGVRAPSVPQLQSRGPAERGEHCEAHASRREADGGRSPGGV